MIHEHDGIAYPSWLTWVDTDMFYIYDGSHVTSEMAVVAAEGLSRVGTGYLTKVEVKLQVKVARAFNSNHHGGVSLADLERQLTHELMELRDRLITAYLVPEVEEDPLEDW